MQHPNAEVTECWKGATNEMEEALREIQKNVDNSVSMLKATEKMGIKDTISEILVSMAVNVERYQTRTSKTRCDVFEKMRRMVQSIESTFRTARANLMVIRNELASISMRRCQEGVPVPKRFHASLTAPKLMAKAKGMLPPKKRQSQAPLSPRKRNPLPAPKCFLHKTETSLWRPWE